MTKKFQVGDIVCINHSDILLTVIEDEIQTQKEGYYKVCWFNEAGDFVTTLILGKALRIEKKEPVVVKDQNN